MRVGIDCHFDSKIKQGTNTYVSELVDAISRNDSSNEYFLLNADYADDLYRASVGNIVKKRIATNSTRRNILYGYRRIARHNKLNVLHTNYLCPFVVPCKTVVTIHDVLYLTHKQYFPNLHTQQLRVLTPITLHLADRLIAVSEYSKRQLVSHFGVDESKIGVTLEAASAEYKVIKNTSNIKTKIKNKYGIENDFLLYVGRLAPIKNIPRMLRILAEYTRKTSSRISFVLVGSYDPVYPDTEIESTIRLLSSDYQIVVLSDVSQEDLVQLYNSAEVLFFVSYGEGFGLPILEAMNCGLPVITSNCTACPETAGDAGILVDPYDDRMIYEALSNVLSRIELRSQIADKGLRRASLFSWNKCAQETIEQYKLCLA